MHFRITALTVLSAVVLFGQSVPAPTDATPDPTAATTIPGSDQATPPTSAAASATEIKPDLSDQIKPDLSDPGVLRARQNLDRIRGLVQQGAMPMNNLLKAQDDLDDAMDMSILRFSASALDLVPEQADQMVSVAQRMLMRRQKRVIQARALAESGIISRVEAEASGTDEMTARLELDLAMQRARLVQDIARSVRMQKSVADLETEADSHPEWNGGIYTRYDGSGVFTRSDFAKIQAAFFSTFGHPIPVSADGQTAVHRSMGYNHTGRVDIALQPDDVEGGWLLRYLQKNHIPYFAFRAAVAGKATGAHIHLGPGSTRIAMLR